MLTSRGIVLLRIMKVRGTSPDSQTPHRIRRKNLILYN